ncbi:Molybdenum transport system permease protein ModB [Novipirellula aureliae]|uniref:Molybdenum transport system permease n=1 Tax=Novipirellula aureliae TaxID=2527966 RepID=A0A5C6EA04_9BACT|nr:molybdate ABC transporter permease subunit [Novipirellula aureliae]TWU45334.1 Molybdenum transport system permease protein ModB [Novipirellula aureliae]
MSYGEWSAIWLSIRVSFVGVLFSLPFGITIGWLLARKQFFAKSVLETVVNLPLVLPPVLTGYLLLITFGRRGIIGSCFEEWLGLRFVFDWKGAALAAAVVSFPLMVRAIRIAFRSVDPKLEQVSRTLGASPLDTFFTVSLPLARHGVIAGCVLAFARSLGEFGATIMIAGSIPGQTQTIPLYIFDQLQTSDGIKGSTTIVLFSIAIAAIALYFGERMDRRVSPKETTL